MIFTANGTKKAAAERIEDILSKIKAVVLLVFRDDSHGSQQQSRLVLGLNKSKSQA
jgi:hypothetical protein